MFTNQRLRAALVLCVLATAANAYADSDDCETPCPQAQPPPAPPPPPPQPAPAPAPMPVEEQPYHAWYDRVGWGLSAGGGVDDFVSGNAQDVTSVGGAWNARLTVGTKYWVAGEVSYIGSAQGIENLNSIDVNANLVGNGVQGALRVNLTRNYFVQPFIYSGGAWRHYDITNSDFNTSDIADSADVFELPLGIGVAGYYRGLMLDARTEYRWAWGDDIVDVGDTSGDMDRWNVTGNIGYEF